MGATEILAIRITPEVKEQIAAVVREEFLTASIWLRRLVLRELRATGSETGARHQADVSAAVSWGHFSDKRASVSLYIRLQPEDRLLLQERAAARGMASATYVSVLVRAHLRSLTPLPKEELIALKRAVSELGAVGRNLNQIARVVNQGGPFAGIGQAEFRAILKICEALRDNTKDLIKTNAASWSAGHAESAD